MAYDPNKNYADAISAAVASGAPKETVAQLNAERNEKIAANAEHYAAKGIGANDQYGTAAQNYVAAAQTAQAVPQSVADLRTLAAQPASAPLSHADASGIRGYLEQSLDAAVQEASERVDRGVTQGVNELQRVREDANEQYQVQQNQVDLDERRALDNQSLYMSMNGMGKSGVGMEQYNSIQNAAARNRVTINNARTKLQTDAARQMAELRANGEFEKSQAYLQATQQYLSQLAQLEQWAQEFNVSVDQFNAQMEESRRNYLLQLKQLEISVEQWEREFAASREDAAWSKNFQQGQAETARNQWEREFAASREDAAWSKNFQQGQAETSRNQWQQEFDASREDAAWSKNFQQGQAETARNQWRQEFDASREDAALQRRQYADSLADKAKQDALSLAESMMNVGMMPDEETLKAAGLSKEYAKLYISAVNAAQNLASEQAAAELEGKRADTLKKTADAAKALSGETGATLSASNAKSLAENDIWNDDVYNALQKNGFSDQTLEQLYGRYQSYKDYMATRNADAADVAKNPGPGMRQSVYAGYEKYVVSVLENGAAPWEQREKALTTRLDAMWPELSVEQRKSLTALLSKYGFSYRPD